MSYANLAEEAPDIPLGKKILRYIAETKPELLVEVIESCPVSITVSDSEESDNPLIYANPSFLEMTGFSMEEIVGENCRFLQGEQTSADDIKSMSKAIEKKESVSLELTNYQKDGTPFINSLKIAPVHDDDGNLLSFIAIQEDVTEQKVKEKKEIQRQRLEALGQMSGGVAHQLNNLLQPVITLISLHKPDIKNENLAKDMELVLESARQAADVVHDVLSFSRQKKDQVANINLLELIYKNVEFIKTMLPLDIEIEVVVKTSSRAIEVCLDPTQFSQVLANLMINSSQAMKGKGNIKLIIENDQKNKVSISVCDNGPGIPTEIREKVLEPFFTTKIEHGGTGLGLSVVYGIIKSFGGSLVIGDGHATGQNSGCNITIFLPVVS